MNSPHFTVGETGRKERYKKRTKGFAKKKEDKKRERKIFKKLENRKQKKGTGIGRIKEEKRRGIF